MMLDFASRAIRRMDHLWVALEATIRRTRNRAGVCFLMFHSIGGLSEADYIVQSGVPSLSPEDFRNMLRFFAQRGFSTLTASHYAVRRLQDEIRPRSLVITFDDGFRDNYTYVGNILAEFGMTATFYVVSGWIGREQPSWLHRAGYYFDKYPEPFADAIQNVAGDRWNYFLRIFPSTNSRSRDAWLMFRQGLRPIEQREALQQLRDRFGCPATSRLYMNWRELRELRRAGMEIGAHTVTHRSLWTLEPRIAKREMIQSKKHLERGLGTAITSFAYPYGHYLPEHTSILASAGYTNAVTVRAHHNHACVGLYELGRYGMNAATSRHELGAICLGRTEDPVARINRSLGRHLGQTQADPDSGIITRTHHGLAYNTYDAAIVLKQQNELSESTVATCCPDSRPQQTMSVLEPTSIR